MATITITNSLLTPVAKGLLRICPGSSCAKRDSCLGRTARNRASGKPGSFQRGRRVYDYPNEPVPVMAEGNGRISRTAGTPARPTMFVDKLMLAVKG